MIGVKIRVRNVLTHAMTLTLEPWGDVEEIQSGNYVDIVAEGPDSSERSDGGLIQIDRTDKGVNVWGWTGSRCEVVRKAGG